jgi:hypothetical protein
MINTSLLVLHRCFKNKKVVEAEEHAGMPRNQLSATHFHNAIETYEYHKVIKMRGHNITERYQLLS